MATTNKFALRGALHTCTHYNQQLTVLRCILTRTCDIRTCACACCRCDANQRQPAGSDASRCRVNLAVLACTREQLRIVRVVRACGVCLDSHRVACFGEHNQRNYATQQTAIILRMSKSVAAQHYLWNYVHTHTHTAEIGDKTRSFINAVSIGDAFLCRRIESCVTQFNASVCVCLSLLRRRQLNPTQKAKIPSSSLATHQQQTTHAHEHL